jgi:hypothetical protein
LYLGLKELKERMKEQRHTHTHNPKEVGKEREKGGGPVLLTGDFGRYTSV